MGSGCRFAGNAPTAAGCRLITRLDTIYQMR